MDGELGGYCRGLAEKAGLYCLDKAFDHGFREITMGPVGLKNLAIVFANAHIFKQLKLDNRPALLLGMNAMRAFKKVSIDFASKKLRMIVPEHSELETRTAEAGGLFGRKSAGISVIR